MYLKTDINQQARIVTGIHIDDNSITYELSCGTEISRHFDFEITEEKDILIATNN